MLKKIMAVLAVLTLIGGSAAIAQPTPRNILIMGTSTTEGMGAVPATNRYVNLVKIARPADTFTVIGRGGTLLVHPDPAKSWENTAIPGGNDIVIAQFGFNEWNTGIPVATFRDQAIAFLARIRAANPTARILWLSTWISQYAAATPDARLALWQDYGVAIDTALRTVQGAHIDMGPTGSRREAAPYSYGGADGLHYNNAGHRKLADAVLAHI